jgi:ActR/RegA family two-component response regulator
MRRTILVADSDSRTAKSLQAALEPRRFAVVEAPDPISLLTLLVWIPVALVVVNPHQGESSRVSSTAVRLLGHLSRQAAFAHLPMVMWTETGVAKLATRIRALIDGDEHC